ncbi:MAG: adenine deaminase [Acidobacteriaceae bacterium]
MVRDILERQIDQAMGRLPADLVVRNARILNLVTGELQPGDIALCGSTIVGTLDQYQGREELDAQGRVAVPGLIDSHVHCESTLVTPGEFDRCVLPHGVTTAICDPHEIANVLGMAGLEYFLEAARNTVIDLRVQLSSCVPATHLETSGARLSATDLTTHRHHPQVIGLAEFMNVPGVLNKDPECMEKLAAFHGEHIDGHSPLLSGRALNAYLSCGIRNCHEVTNPAEGREKLAKGRQVLIREGSVSKDLSALVPLIGEFTSPFLGLCTDDRNPLDIHEEGHLDLLVRRAIALGAPVAAVYRVASWSAARGFGLTDRGLIAPGYLADFLLLDDLETCAVHTVFRRGRRVTPDIFAGRNMPQPGGGNTILREPVTEENFRVPATGPESAVIGIIPRKILTEYLQANLPFHDGLRHADPEHDLLKICVLERHGRNGNIGRGFVKGFGFRRGALASSVGHDSHNLCVVGAGDRDMALAINRLLTLGGGLVAVEDGRVLAELALPFAGLMSLEPFETVTRHLYALRAAVQGMGCRLEEPFLHLAFLPLPVIPHLKITDMGLVDVDRFQLLPA